MENEARHLTFARSFQQQLAHGHRHGTFVLPRSNQYQTPRLADGETIYTTLTLDFEADATACGFSKTSGIVPRKSHGPRPRDGRLSQVAGLNRGSVSRRS